MLNAQPRHVTTFGINDAMVGKKVEVTKLNESGVIQKVKTTLIHTDLYTDRKKEYEVKLTFTKVWVSSGEFVIIK
jgi:hypothetical protein